MDETWHRRIQSAPCQRAHRCGLDPWLHPVQSHIMETIVGDTCRWPGLGFQQAQARRPLYDKSTHHRPQSRRSGATNLVSESTRGPERKIISNPDKTADILDERQPADEFRGMIPIVRLLRLGMV